MADITVLRAENQYHYALCVALRYEVFVIEQECPLLEECTPTEDQCHHYIALDANGQPLGTARWRLYDDKTGKIERVATLKAARGKGVASQMLQRIMADIQAETSAETIILGAQDVAMPLYEKLGFTVYGEGFMEAGIPHHMMQKTL